MNLHPIFVHFPIALLTVYAVLELARFKKLQERLYAFHVKATLVILGAVSSIPAYLTGSEQLEAMPPASPFYRTVVIHSHWALATVLIFGFLAAVKAAEWLLLEWTSMPERLKKPLGWSRYVAKSALAPILALIGLACVTVTGALGGAIAYGPDVDPVVTFVYKLLVK